MNVNVAFCVHFHRHRTSHITSLYVAYYGLSTVVEPACWPDAYDRLKSESHSDESYSLRMIYHGLKTRTHRK